MLLEAGQSEILRAAQRDDTFKKQFNENVSDIVLSVCGIHFFIKNKGTVEKLFDVLYHLMTTMSNLQTLGEEYTGIIQVDSSVKALPKKHLQLLMILLNNYGEKIMIETLQKFEKIIEKLPEHQIRQEARKELIKMSNILKSCIPFISKFYKALFYFSGHYFEIGNRICGIKYALVRYWLKDRSSLLAFKMLSIVTFVQSAISLVFAIFNYKSTVNENVFESKTMNKLNDVCDKCSLCLNVRQNTTTTPCGHLFCWSCIIPWLQDQARCPLCRQTFQPSRIVFLQNYSSSNF